MSPSPSTTRFSTTSLARNNRATRWVRVVRPRQRSWMLSLPVASQENLSSSIQKFRILIRTEIDNTRHARGECGHDFWCRAKRNLAPPNNMPGSSHVQMPRITVETPSAIIVENIQHVFAVSFTDLRHVGFIAPVPALCPVQAMYARTRSVVENIPTVGVLHTLLIFEGCVKARRPSCVGLGWSCSSGDVMSSRIRRGHRHLHSSAVFLIAKNILSARRWRACVPLSRTQGQSTTVMLCATPSSSRILVERHARFVR